MGSALRGTGIVKPTMMVQVLTVVLNTVFAPIFIAGWGTHHAFGAAGAGFASTLAVAIGVVFLWVLFHQARALRSPQPQAMGAPLRNLETDTEHRAAGRR